MWPDKFNFRYFKQTKNNNNNNNKDDDKHKNRNRLRDYILILLFASLLYLNSLDADFAYDDK